MTEHTLAEYNKLVADRPEKWTPESVSYRRSTGDEECHSCVHFFKRRVDGYGVCEIMRPADTEAKGVAAGNVCDFWSEDGENFPLLEDTSHESD